MNISKLLIATHNKTKFAQIKELLKHSPIELVSLADLGITHDVEETGTTLKENALLKAHTYCKLAGIPTLADDSGVEVDALNGEPGVYSKRYAGEGASDAQICAYLLEKMKEVPAGKRDAAFSSVIALTLPDGATKCFSGSMKGSIALDVRGTPIAHFPYCSIFVAEGSDNKTITELTDAGLPVRKDHRVKALEQLVKELV